MSSQHGRPSGRRDDIELNSYLHLLRRHWWLLIAGPLIATLIAYVGSKRITPVYETSATLLINQTQTPGVVLYNDILTSERLTNTYAELIKGPSVLDEAVARIPFPVTSRGLAATTSVSVIQNTQLLKVTVRNNSPGEAATIANTLASVFIDQNASSLGRPGTVTTAERARIPTSPASPNIKLNTAAAAVLGFVAFVGLAFLLDYLDDTVKSDRELGAGFPVLGQVRRLHLGKKRAPVRVDVLESSEAYARLRTNIHFAGLTRTLKAIVVTSAGAGEGKSTTASGLALGLARSGARVVLVDADLRRPSVHRIFRVSNSFGLTGLILSRRNVAATGLVSTVAPNLSVLPAGPLPPNPADLLLSSQLAGILADLRETFDYVIIDTPPLLAVTDAAILAGSADGTLVVVQAGKTRRTALQRALQELEGVQSLVIGLVFNRVRDRSDSYYHYRYEEENPSRPRLPREFSSKPDERAA